MKSYINHILLLALGVLMFGSCSSDDNLTPDPGKGQNEQIRFEISFAGEINPTTRAATDNDFKTTWEPDDEIGLFIVQGNGGLQASGNYVHNMKLTRLANGSWDYQLPTDKEFYPSSTDQLHFYAYYPYNDNGGNPQMLDPTTYTFGVKADQNGITGSKSNYNTSDLMLAKTENVGISKDAVQLKFHHALALVQVEVKREVNVPLFDGNFTVTLKGAKRNATLGWSSNLTATGTPSDIVMHKVANMPYTYRALVPAQTLSADTKVSFVQTTTNKKIDMEYHSLKSIALTAKAAHKRSVTLGWGIDPEHRYAIGNAYPHTGPVVGIVYYVTNGGRHGKVLGLSENSSVQWATSNSTTNATNTANGRVNMKTIKGINPTFNGFPVFEWVHEKNDAGQTYSDANATRVWYLPAKDELVALYSAYNTYGKSNFNSKLTAAGGIGLDNSYYWSSSESNDGNAWLVTFLDGGIYWYIKNYNGRARCVLAF